MKIFGYETDNITGNITRTKFAHPDSSRRDWTIFAITSLVVLTLLVIFAVRIFLQVDSKNFVQATSDTGGVSVLTLDKEQLSQTVADLRKQQIQFEIRKDQPKQIPNPAR